MPEDAPGNPGALPGWPDDDSPAEAGDDSPVLAGRVRGMQAKLHRWAGDDSSRRFDDLFSLVCDLDFLVAAWDRARTNKGARTPGIDGVRVTDVENRAGGAGAFLDEIREQLKTGAYRPSEVRQVMIPKKSGKTRKLGIPTEPANCPVAQGS